MVRCMDAHCIRTPWQAHSVSVDNNVYCRDEFAKIDIESACLWIDECYTFFDIGPILSLPQLRDRNALKSLKHSSWELAKSIFTLCDWIGSNADWQARFPFHAKLILSPRR